MTTTDIDAMCAEQNEMCARLLADAEARRAETQHVPTYSEKERAEHLTRAARDLAYADVRLERAVTEKRLADHELDLAKRSRLLAHDAYSRAVTACASSPATPEEARP